MRGHRQQRALMWKLQGGRCFWCGCRTVLPPKGRSRGRSAPDNEATTDHLDSRLSPERGKHPGKYRRVMACRRCNNTRKEWGVSMLPQDYWQRCGNIYGMAKMTGALNEVQR